MQAFWAHGMGLAEAAVHAALRTLTACMAALHQAWHPAISRSALIWTESTLIYERYNGRSLRTVAAGVHCLLLVARQPGRHAFHMLIA